MRDMTYVAKRDVRCVCEAELDGDAVTAGILASPAFGFPRALLRLLRATRNPSPRLSWASSIPRTSGVIVRRLADRAPHAADRRPSIWT